MLAPIIYIDHERRHLTNSIIFSGGEVHVNVSHLPAKCSHINIWCRLQSSDDILQLMMLSDALYGRYSSFNPKVILQVPYVPYARQDRRCAEGDAFGITVFAKMLNLCWFDKLYVADIHSQAGLGILRTVLGREVQDTTQDMILGFRDNLEKLNLSAEETIVVAPDKGSTEKAKAVAQTLGLEVTQGHKLRNPKTGKLSGFDVDCLDFKGRDVFITDDLCDGGGTFLGLISVLKERNCGKVTLYVTHGLFSKGIKVFEGKVDHIITTNSFDRGIKPECTDIKFTTLRLN